MSPSHAKSRPASRSTSPGKPAGKPSGKPTRAQKREAKKQRKATKGPGFLGQIKQVFKMTREVEPNIGWWMLLIGLGVLLVFLLIGVLLGNWITGLLIGLPFALLAASFYLSRRAERAAFARIEDQPGAAGAALSALRRGWIVEDQPAAMDPRTRDLIFRAIGRPGVVLVTEGPAGRVDKLVAKERRRIGPVIQNVPIHVIKTGKGEGQVPLRELSKRMKKLDKKLTQQEVQTVHKRISTLGNRLPIPKGVDPMRARPDRRAMRGR
ncbi:DUF4191 domain-containing protein [Kocuria rosea]|uniref:DUF4191 domain-containing protein n=1 Tax=Kocuria TaxID=57493 RepID=UPI000D659484|nr:DUF4191 domain-containing protein [Kocuria rosea]PWF85707.1 DUF4191 domain-containing protein [Kocuria rosea]QCY33359.1 DUF4191 family protein [Kocuria rosea]THE17510.1 DUF4191 family protein [Kocuria rosea]TQN36104.1 uncharacterized protein DUF4191 [Kocuria rosea]